MADPIFADPLAWRMVKAPSLEELETLAETAFRRLPQKFRALCEGLVIRVEDFPTEEVLDELGAQSEFDLLGLFQGVGLPFRSENAPGPIITHVLVHEIGHHFGLSDHDMAAIEASVS
jgi:predicted Zn-dependent protease with MMP-like domain